MASWSLLEAASGFAYDAGSAEIGFAPVITPHDYRAPFVTRDGWGTFSQRATEVGQVDALELNYGSLVIKTLRFCALGQVQAVAVSVDGADITATWSQSGEQMDIALGDATTLHVGSTLSVRLS
jgi:hypothetical protein